MAILPVVLHPHPVLRENTTNVTNMTDAVRTLAQNLFDTMFSIPHGVGLAAPQIGVATRMAVVFYDTKRDFKNRLPTKENSLCLINPRILKASDELVEMEEGCLSIPDMFAPVSRPRFVTVEYMDVAGNIQTITPDEGILTAAILHEMDHLDGVLFPDHLSRLRQERLYTKYKKILPSLVKHLDYPFT
ncbi:MAG: peptide deformylase [Alphaproteobacteria bacterium]